MVILQVQKSENVYNYTAFNYPLSYGFTIYITIHLPACIRNDYVAADSVTTIPDFNNYTIREVATVAYCGNDSIGDALCAAD